MTKKLVKPLPKTKFPKWKVQPMLMSVDFIFPLIWMLGVTFYMDETNMHFEGHHRNKLRMTYKE